VRVALISLMALLAPQAARAGDISVRPSLEFEQKVALGLERDDTSQALWTLRPKARVRLPGRWSSDIALRMEAAGGETGLGTRETYARISRPLKISPDVRLEVDEAVLSWRRRGARVRLGKQTVAWGVLDGLQVTDRFDATRRREAVFIDNRPDRIARWGARAELGAGGLRWDAAALFDGTSDQFAERGDAFEVVAPRFRAGLPVGAPLPALQFDTPDDPTLGLRATKTFGANDASLLVINGPDTEPVISPATGGVLLNYKTRTLIGATWQRSSGARVLRTELAWAPAQPVNLDTPLLGLDRRDRVLAGVGVDWDLPNGFFANAQIGADWVQGDDLVRPNTDVITTIRIQRGWRNDTLRARAEAITSLSDGDGTFRPSLSWQASDTLRLEGGVDIVWGPLTGLIGQYRDRDRAWMRVRFSI